VEHRFHLSNSTLMRLVVLYLIPTHLNLLHLQQ
jgi:hypothetical protein